MNTKQTVGCTNARTGRTIQIDRSVYDLISSSILHVLQRQAPLTYTQLVKAVEHHLKEINEKIDGSLSWYTVTIKSHLEQTRKIRTWEEKGKKWHALTAKIQADQ